MASSSPEFVALSEEELAGLDEEARRTYDEEKAAFEEAAAAAQGDAAPEDGAEDADAGAAADVIPNTTRSTDIESARADGSAVANGDDEEQQQAGDAEGLTVEIFEIVTKAVIVGIVPLALVKWERISESGSMSNPIFSWV